MGSRIKENPESTFEVFVEVTRPVATDAEPQLERQFPEDFSDQETLRAVSRFCFPFSTDRLPVGLGQNFTFVLTDVQSKHRFGFCRLSSGAQRCFCLLSYLPWFEVFYKLLHVLSDYSIKSQVHQQRELLETLYTLSIPEPGVPVHLSVHSHFIVPDIKRLPSIPENRSLKEYFVAVDINNILHLYASMLFERRILICCSRLSTLTSCIHGSAAMLYPMYWQHVYIPVLPQYLIDYCCAPMPYLIGVHSSLMEKVRKMVLDDVVIFDVDTNTLETPYDDLQSLPNDAVSSLKSRLKKVSMATGDGVARAFLGAQAALFGSYRSALRMEPGELITFDKEVFVSHRSSTMRHFLQNAIQLQLFKQFIDGRLDLLNSGKGFSDAFEEEINAGEYAGSDKSYHQWLSTVKKGGGAIFNTVKTRANPAMKNVYKFAKDHARMGIKEVKNRLKQKDLQENGYSTTKDSQQQSRKDSQSCDQQQPMREQFRQRPLPPQLLVQNPLRNMEQESNGPDLLQKEAGLVQGEEPQEDEGAKSSPRTPPSDMAERAQRVDLLGDIFWSLQGEPESPSVNLLPKSLVDIRPVGGSVEAQANSTHQVAGEPHLLPLPINADITDPVAVSNGSTDLLSLLDPLSRAPGTEAPPPAPTAPALCPRPLGPLTVTRIPVPPFAQSSNHVPVGRPHGNYTPPGPPQRLFTPAAATFAPLNHNHQPCLPPAPLKHSGLPLQSSALPGLIRTKAPQSRAPPETQDPFGDLLDLSKLAAPPKTRQWETFD